MIAAVVISGSLPTKENFVYAAIRQGKAKTGTAEELARRIKEGAIPIISDVEGFMAYYVVYAPDDTVTAIIFRTSAPLNRPETGHRSRSVAYNVK